MDPNKQQPASPQQPAAPTVAQPTAAPLQPPTVPPLPTAAPTMPPSMPAKKGHGLLIFIFVLMILVIFGAVGYFLFMGQRTSTFNEATESKQQTPPTVTPTPAPSQEEKDIEAIDDGATDSSDLLQVQTDVETL